MRKFTAILFFQLFFIAANAQNYSFVYDSQVRNYIVHLPAGYTSSGNYPLVFNFHGYTSNALQQQFYTGMDAVADSNHFIVVYPDGINNAWNVGFGFGAYNTGVDDVGFTNALLDTLMAHYSINPARVYACGMSNGGYMSHRLACELENRIAAVASVTGLLNDSTAYYCNTSRYVPVMQIHGTADPVVSYNGGFQSQSVEATLTFWFTNNGCTVPADTSDFPDINTADNTTVQRIWYNSCNGGSEVMFYKVINGGHTWPGGAIDIPSNGNTNRDINASANIWQFFNRFTINGPVGVEETNSSSPVEVYPNPFGDHLYLKSCKEIIRWGLYDMSGRNIVSGKNQGVIIPGSIPSGIYVLKVETAGGINYRKLVHQE